MGGFTSSKKEVIDMLRQRSRPYLFSNSLAPHIVGASIAVLDMLNGTTALRDKLEWNINYFKEGLRKVGLEFKNGDSAIVPVMLYDAKLSQQFADELLKESRGKTLDFMTALCARIQSRFSYEVRPAGEPASPERTLTSLRGSCRDFVVLAIATARSAGLACRFVSGYCIPEKPSGPPELHAWMEVYLCGGGWRGFDPTLGLACQENHIALATGPSSAMAMPVQGTFRGDARSEMEVTLAYEKQ
jgi:transglutaminase-like putative cysteine protease